MVARPYWNGEARLPPLRKVGLVSFMVRVPEPGAHVVVDEHRGSVRHDQVSRLVDDHQLHAAGERRIRFGGSPGSRADSQRTGRRAPWERIGRPFEAEPQEFGTSSICTMTRFDRQSHSKYVLRFPARASLSRTLPP